LCSFIANILNSTGSDIQKGIFFHGVVYPMGKPSGGGQADDTPSPLLSRVRSKWLRLHSWRRGSEAFTPEAGKPRLLQRW